MPSASLPVCAFTVLGTTLSELRVAKAVDRIKNAFPMGPDIVQTMQSMSFGIHDPS